MRRGRPAARSVQTSPTDRANSSARRAEGWVDTFARWVDRTDTSSKGWRGGRASADPTGPGAAAIRPLDRRGHALNRFPSCFSLAPCAAPSRAVSRVSTAALPHNNKMLGRPKGAGRATLDAASPWPVESTRVQGGGFHPVFIASYHVDLGATEASARHMPITVLRCIERRGVGRGRYAQSPEEYGRTTHRFAPPRPEVGRHQLIVFVHRLDNRTGGHPAKCGARATHHET